jgi:hypothetical protein
MVEQKVVSVFFQNSEVWIAALRSVAAFSEAHARGGPRLSMAANIGAFYGPLSHPFHAGHPEICGRLERRVEFPAVADSVTQVPFYHSGL